MSRTEGEVRAAFDGAAAWRATLKVTNTNEPRAMLANAIIALRDAPDWQGVLAHDEFALRTLAQSPPPWCRGMNGAWRESEWTDYDDTRAAEWLQRNDIRVTSAVAAEAAQAVAKMRSFHPVRNYLADLRWDGKQRIASFARTCLDADDTPYHATAVKCMFVSGVARIMSPGCQADITVILEGAQGLGKSTLLRSTFHPWFTDELADLGSKDAAMQLAGVWGIEISELSGMTRSELEKVKAFLTRREDRFRPSYGRRVLGVKRQCIFIGTTNEHAYLKDATGGRRYLPITCGEKLDVSRVARDKDQLWAEAVHMHKAGESWWIADPSDAKLAREAQEFRYVADPWEDPISEYLEGIDGSVSVSEVLKSAVFVDLNRQGQADQNRVVRCLQRLGWKQLASRKSGRRYAKPEPDGGHSEE
jgi:predicted P-loop ATPase